MDFTKAHYNTLLNKLNISNDKQIFDLKKGTLIDAIEDYFNLTFQRISVDITLNTCSITKNFIDEAGSEEFDRLLYTNSKLLINTAQQKENLHILPFLLLIPEEVKNTVFQLFLDQHMTMTKARTLTRFQVEPIFDLSEKDIIFFLRGRMWIRYFTPPKKINDGKDKRYAGESVEELNAMFSTYFPNGIWQDIKSILDEVLDQKLNFSIIDNATFTKTFIPVFRGMIEILLIDVISPDEREKIEGFTGYVLRKYFDQILLHTAKYLLTFVENRDKNAELFIKNYSDDVLIDSTGKKTYKYAIIDSKQQTWNYVTILSILIQYKQAKLRIVTQSNIIAGVKDQLKEAEKHLLSENNNQKIQEIKIDNLLKQITESDLLNFKNKKAMDPSQTKHHEDLIAIKRTEDNELYLIKNRIANTTIEITRLQKKFKHESEAKQILKEQIVPLQKTYERIASALVLVLVKR
ncbi:MAG: hypothetical protein B7X89_02840 [Sulfuricurvum sp. 17-40-25]|nr:MAG: hypothetical protein B7Y30_10935 [Campylobacterales bacterium 16-40-21]OZA03621.1 MAG: hypothetical protein B7X89_02840 [Sulfuricurvum sp. 17-40-25]